MCKKIEPSCRTGQISFIQFYFHTRSGMQKKDEQNQDTANTNDEDTAGNIVFCSFLPR